MMKMERFHGILYRDCEAVQRGMKDFATITIKVDAIDAVVEAVQNYDVLYHIQKADDLDVWVALHIYKDPIMKEIIQQLPDDPNTAYDHYVNGKAYGYRSDQIFNFIRELQMSGKISKQ